MTIIDDGCPGCPTLAVFAAGFALGALLTAGLGWWALRRRTKMLGRFFSFAAHEFNTPITAVNMTLINLLSGVFGDIPEDQVRWIEMMREQVGRLNGMVGEMRDLIHMQIQGDLQLSPDEAEAAELVQEATGLVRRGMQQSGIEVKVKLSDELPKVSLDRERAVRSIVSLLFHARKFRASGNIEIETVPAGASPAVHIRYKGHALAASEAQRSLDLFYPANKRRDMVLGATGLGLGLLREINRRQGGDLELKIAQDGQTELILRLPASRMVESRRA